ncbi:hypothetical protein C8R46DRAFT_1072401 [Mycena filopes]|nr:hypothetical protein C8R46DRAFT_1072401 [Mycena filopes]
MATSPRLTSSPFASSSRYSLHVYASMSHSPPEQFNTDPATPLRGSQSRMAGEHSSTQFGNDSPTSTLSESASFRFNDSASRSAFRTTYTPVAGTPIQKSIIRSDASILTTFDPADRELYDLWAPKN